MKASRFVFIALFFLVSACDDNSGAITSSRSAITPAADAEPMVCSTWPQPWIGAPCSNDEDCSYEGGICLGEVAGFACGSCSRACESFCPDRQGFPVTFCVNGSELGIQDSGNCVSKCDPRLGENDDQSCRDGYSCQVLQRASDPGVEAGVCAPGEADEERTSCRRTLAAMGVSYTSVERTPQSPEGHPQLLCDIVDPVLVFNPLGEITLRHIRQGAESPALVSCDAAIAIARASSVATEMGAKVIHYSRTYGCTLIAGSEELSMHGRGAAIDILGFTLEDGVVLSVNDDWAHGAVEPATEGGIWLRAFADTLWAEEVFSVILTPEFNDDHHDHLHLDLTPATMFYE